MWLQGAILLSILIGVSFWLLSAEEAPSGQEDLKILVAELRSQAAEGRLLTEQASTKNLTTVYLRSQTSQLKKNLDSTIKDLDSLKIELGLEEKTARAKESARKLSADIVGLSDLFDNPQAASALRGDFDGLFSQLLELENGLKPQH
jgi:hypothetical protein